MSDLTLHVGLKTDSVQYRYSYEWLFRLLAEEGIGHAQLGSFFEMYQLPDEYFIALRRQAERYGVRISSVFTTHRELGGWFRQEPGWEAVIAARLPAHDRGRRAAGRRCGRRQRGRGAA